MKRALPGTVRGAPGGNSLEHDNAWKGDNLHLPVVEGGLPVSCLLTAASLHDNQSAPIPLKKMARKVQGCCLADAAYDEISLRTLAWGLGLASCYRPESPERGYPVQEIGWLPMRKSSGPRSGNRVVPEKEILQTGK
ncbi:MAG: hypothetical protein ACYCYP_10555 [Leptospirales bacterium]